VACCLVVNIGFGLRGPPGFHRAVVASGDDEARGAALVVLGILATAGTGTAVTAPMISDGLVPTTAVATGVAAAALVSLVALPRLNQAL
jgi:hypothetical protein